MPAKKTAKRSPRKAKQNVNVNVNVGVTNRTWVLFALFLLASAFTFYQISLNRY